MYAVIRTGNKQHKVSAGDQIRVELLEGRPGDRVTFEPLLVIDDEGGAHVGKDVAGAVVTARLLGETKGEKIRVFKYRPKTGYRRTQGHRQRLSLLEVESVELRQPVRPAAASPSKAEGPKKATAKPAARKPAAARKPTGRKGSVTGASSKS